MDVDADVVVGAAVSTVVATVEVITVVVDVVVGAAVSTVAATVEVITVVVDALDPVTTGLSCTRTFCTKSVVASCCEVPTGNDCILIT